MKSVAFFTSDQTVVFVFRLCCRSLTSTTVLVRLVVIGLKLLFAASDNMTSHAGSGEARGYTEPDQGCRGRRQVNLLFPLFFIALLMYFVECLVDSLPVLLTLCCADSCSFLRFTLVAESSDPLATMRSLYARFLEHAQSRVR